jgi:hypothetical protein
MIWREVIDNVCKNNIGSGLTTHPKGVIQGIYWSEDNNGNINFDVESIREEFEYLLSCLEEYNETSNFDWDNC